jgi:glycosyltransferase involved in cell wall biosynthesis
MERRIAIVHDWLVTYAGAERVLEGMLNCYPEADLFSLIDFVPNADRGFIRRKPVVTSFLQRIPFVNTRYRNFLPLMPLAIEQFDLSSYDLVISSSYAVAKGVITSPRQLHLCMCYSPVRYAWDLQHQYLREAGLDGGLTGVIARVFLHRLRMWDAVSAQRVDEFIAISDFIRQRIQKVYRRDAAIIYPPVDLDRFTPEGPKGDFYLTASRMVPYKRIPLIVEAFREMPDKQLIVIGDGPDMRRAKTKAPANVRLLGHQPFEVLRNHLRRSRAFIFAAEEDFGIAPLEAQACGTPVIAYGRGGALETISRDPAAPTGILFKQQTTADIRDAIRRFESTEHAFHPAACRANAQRFNSQRFHEEFIRFVESRWQAFHSRADHS